MSDPSPAGEQTVDSPVLDALGDGLLVLDPESGTVSYANEAAVSLLEGDPTGSTLADRLAAAPTLDLATDARRRAVWEFPTDEPPPAGTPAAGRSGSSRPTSHRQREHPPPGPTSTRGTWRRRSPTLGTAATPWWWRRCVT